MVGRLQELVCSCFYMNVEVGYLKVRKFFDNKFGQKYKIIIVYVDKVINGFVIKVEDVEVLEVLLFCWLVV